MFPRPEWTTPCALETMRGIIGSGVEATMAASWTGITIASGLGALMAPGVVGIIILSLVVVITGLGVRSFSEGFLSKILGIMVSGFRVVLGIVFELEVISRGSARLQATSS